MGKVASLLNFVDENLRLLEDRLGELGSRRIVEDTFLFYSAIHILQVSAQALIDLASRIIAEAGLGLVDRYTAIPEILAERGVLSPEDALLLRRIIGFRNVAVHCYTKMSREVVREILEGRKYRDMLRLASILVEWARGRGVDP